VPVLQIEHPVRDFEAWKVVFDGDPARREVGGVQRYEIYRPIDDPNYVGVNLEFDSQPAAEAFKQGLEELWRSPQASSALGGTPRARIVDIIESKAY
jgi:hypothetical protein